VTYKPQHKMIAKLIGARNEIEDVLRASSQDGTLLSSAERDRLSSILSLIESLLQDLEEGPPNTSASAARHFRPRRRISSSDMSIFIRSTPALQHYLSVADCLGEGTYSDAVKYSPSAGTSHAKAKSFAHSIALAAFFSCFSI
jgi:hypothetical protein